jgi:hypothetical protein
VSAQILWQNPKERSMQKVGVMGHYMPDELDQRLAVLGAIFSLAFTIWSAVAIGRLIYLTVGILVCFACTIYLIIRRSVSSAFLSSVNSLEMGNHIYLALNILFFAFFSFTIISLCWRPEPYVRPLDYFIITAVMTSVLAVEILFLPRGRWPCGLALFKMVLIGLSLEFSQLLIFPSIVGVDPWYHQMLTLKIIDTGHIAAGYDYSLLPVMHLLIGSTSLLTGLGYKMSTMLSVSLLQVLSDSLFTFLLGNLLFGKKIGLFAGLLLNVANWHVDMGFWAVPNTMGATLIPPILYLLLKKRDGKTHISIFIAILLMATSILTHAITAGCLAILLFVFWAGFKVYNLEHHDCKTLENPLPLSIPVLYAAGMLSWWTYASGHINTLAELIKWGFSSRYFLALGGPMPSAVIQYTNNVPFSEQLLNTLGMRLFFSISMIGCLYMLSKKSGNSRSFAMAIGGASIFITSSFAMLTGNALLIPERWFYFSQILLALPLAVALLLLCCFARSNLAKTMLLMFLMFSLTFFMIMSTSANLDNPTFSPDIQVRYGFTGSELEAIEKASRIWNGTIGADAHYSDLRWSSYSIEDISEQIYDRNYTQDQNMFVLVREEVVDNPFILFQVVYKLDYDPRNTLTEQGFDKVYDCGSVSGFAYSKS